MLKFKNIWFIERYKIWQKLEQKKLKELKKKWRNNDGNDNNENDNNNRNNGNNRHKNNNENKICHRIKMFYLNVKNANI